MLDNKKYSIDIKSTARDALKKLNTLGEPGGVLFIVNDKERIVGTITDGDIRRGLLRDYDVDDPVKKYMNKKFRHFDDNNFTKERIKELKSFKIRFAPYLDGQGRMSKVIRLDDIHTVLPVDAVIMAGGRGVRLMPLTQTTPKPLLKIEGKPIIEYCIDRLCKFGINNVAITVGYLGKQIKEYFGDGTDKRLSIRYVTERKPLGTIGGVGLIKEFRRDHLLIMNADILTNFDIEDVYDTFVRQDADMIVLTVPYSVNVPYAVMEVGDDQNVLAFKEKPRYTYHTNAGVYIMKKAVLDLIPKKQKFDATDLMQLVIEKGLKLITEPILGYWQDIGRMEDFVKAQEDLKHLKF